MADIIMTMSNEKPPMTPNQAATEISIPETLQTATTTASPATESPTNTAHVTPSQPTELYEQIKQLQTQIANLQNRLQQQQESQLRHLAEQQNLQRRAGQELEKAHRFSIEKFVKSLLPVVDSFEHAMALEKQLINLPTHEKLELLDKLLEGIELTYHSLQETLNKQQVTAVGIPGEPFNPEQHEAMAVVDNAEMPTNHVVTVMQKGYQLHNRLLRPAMVTVSRSNNP